MRKQQLIAVVSEEFKTLASGSADSTILIWNIDNGQLLKTLTGHSKDIWTLALLPDKTLASGSTDNSIRIRDLESDQNVKTLKGHSGLVLSLVELQDGSLASSSTDRSIIIWNLQDGVT